jgi:hypothetical protein
VKLAVSRPKNAQKPALAKNRCRSSAACCKQRLQLACCQHDTTAWCIRQLCSGQLHSARATGPSQQRSDPRLRHGRGHGLTRSHGLSSRSVVIKKDGRKVLVAVAKQAASVRPDLKVRAGAGRQSRTAGSLPWRKAGPPAGRRSDDRDAQYKAHKQPAEATPQPSAVDLPRRCVVAAQPDSWPAARVLVLGQPAPLQYAVSDSATVARTGSFWWGLSTQRSAVAPPPQGAAAARAAAVHKSIRVAKAKKATA